MRLQLHSHHFALCQYFTLYWDAEIRSLEERVTSPETVTISAAEIRRGHSKPFMCTHLEHYLRRSCSSGSGFNRIFVIDKSVS